MAKSGRKPTTGPFETREELVSKVWYYYESTSMNMSQIAKKFGITQPSVGKIIDNKEGYEAYKNSSE